MQDQVSEEALGEGAARVAVLGQDVRQQHGTTAHTRGTEKEVRKFNSNVQTDAWSNASHFYSLTFTGN